MRYNCGVKHRKEGTYMNVVTTTTVFPRCYDAEKFTERLAAIGFKHLDLGLDYCISKPEYPFMTDEYEKWAYSIGETAEKCGAIYTHSHAPVDVSSGQELIDRSFRCAQILGIKYMVVHPKWIGLEELSLRRFRRGRFLQRREHRFLQRFHRRLRCPLLRERQCRRAQCQK